MIRTWISLPARDSQEIGERIRSACGPYRRDVSEPGTKPAGIIQEKCPAAGIVRSRAIYGHKDLGAIEGRPLILHPRIGEGEEELHQGVLCILRCRILRC